MIIKIEIGQPIQRLYDSVQERLCENVVSETKMEERKRLSKCKKKIVKQREWSPIFVVFVFVFIADWIS